jgi:hypothetical protein
LAAIAKGDDATEGLRLERTLAVVSFSRRPKPEANGWSREKLDWTERNESATTRE